MSTKIHKPHKKKTRKPFNWVTTLQDLIKEKADRNFALYLRLLKRAGDWPTCACGQLCKVLPRNWDGEPEDRVLSRLGIAFYKAIRIWDLKGALEIFRKIEVRSTALILLQKNNTEREK